MLSKEFQSHFSVTFRSLWVDAPESLLSHFRDLEMIWGVREGRGSRA